MKIAPGVTMSSTSQPPVLAMDEKVKRALGEQLFSILVLQAQLEQRDGQIAALKMRVEVADKEAAEVAEVANAVKKTKSGKP